jgi:hypothetical protein
LGNGIIQRSNLALGALVLAALVPLMSVAVGGMGGIGFLIFLAALGFAAVNGILAYNGLAQFWSRINEGMQNHQSSKERKKELGENLITFANRVGRQEHVTHTKLQSELRRAAHAISSGQSAAMVFANLSTNFPQLNTNAQYQSVHQKFVEIEEKIDRDTRQLNAMIGEWNGILSSFPLEQLSRQLPFNRVKFRS